MNELSTTDITIAPATSTADRAWLADLWRREWGGEVMISRGRAHHVDSVAALIAFDGERRVGAVTYVIDGGDCELTSVDAVDPRTGIGTKLLRAVEQAALADGCTRVWLITTNDNLDALRFYQRRGYHLTQLHRDAITESRRLKPSISLIGAYGIPIRDEIELEKTLG